MTQLQKGLQREIAAFSEAILSDGGSIPEVSKAAFCKARKKLKPSAFIELSKLVLETFYKREEVIRWHSYRVLGVDGSTIELPNSADIREQYGVFQSRDDGKAVCLGRTLLIYDTLNHLTLYGSVDKMAVSETNMFIESIEQQAPDSKDLFVFDRYYASQLLYFFLAQQGVRFCMRLKLNWWEPAKKFYASGKASEVLTIQLPQDDMERAKELGITLTSTRVRLVRVELPGGVTELLLTNLTNERQFSVAAIKELYALRWPVEEAYKSFKHKVCLGNFSGKSKKAVLQDFYVKLFIMNLTAVLAVPINQALAKKTVKVKYHHQCNFTEALATMKKAVVSLFITNKVTTALQRCIERFYRFTEPIRPRRKNNRKRLPKRKFYMNYKMP